MSIALSVGQSITRGSATQLSAVHVQLAAPIAPQTTSVRSIICDQLRRRPRYQLQRSLTRLLRQHFFREMPRKSRASSQESPLVSDFNALHYAAIDPMPSASSGVSSLLRFERLITVTCASECQADLPSSVSLPRDRCGRETGFILHVLRLEQIVLSTWVVSSRELT